MTSSSGKETRQLLWLKCFYFVRAANTIQEQYYCFLVHFFAYFPLLHTLIVLYLLNIKSKIKPIDVCLSVGR